MPKNKPSHKIPEGEPKGPSSPEEAREWLEAVALHLSKWPNASRRFQFVGRALLQYLTEGGKGEQELRSALGLTPHNFPTRKGRPKGSLKTDASIVEMLWEGRPLVEIREALEVPLSRIERVRARINKLLGLRQHGAKPDGVSLEDASALASKIPNDMLVAMLSATISAKDILPE